jgi:4-amino-4-deoxy-L-arabinose transferase-like glycosyltransferase
MIVLEKKSIYLFYLLIAIVYGFGMFLPLMENDSAQHAVMSMRMYLENDFFTIMRGTEAYLDKPHMHFWLAAISYKIFGIYDWAYRIPALLFTLLGAISTYQLTKELYHKNVAHIAALIFLTSQSIILANHDVRTDAVLTGATIFSIWQLFLFTKTKKILPIVLGAIGMGIAFSTKGLFGVFIIGISILLHLLYTRNLKVLFSYKIFIGLIVFVASISPVLYAYYVQFGADGVQFILWDQNFDRLSAANAAPIHPEFHFFFHTLLWVFAPWALIFYFGLFKRIRSLVRTKCKLQSNFEVLTFGGAVITLLILSTSQFKLPHYLNPLLPLFAIFTAGFLHSLMENKQVKTVKIFLYIQYFLVGVSVVGMVFLLFFTFDFPKVYTLVGMTLLLLYLGRIVFSKDQPYRKIIAVSVVVMIFANFGLNSYFYPELLNYQAGIPMSKLIEENKIPKKSIYIHNQNYSWTLDFYTQRNTPSINIEELKNLDTDIWLFTDKKQSLDELKENDISIQGEYVVDHFRVAKLNLTFLNPKSRAGKLKKGYLLHIVPKFSSMTKSL